MSQRIRLTGTADPAGQQGLSRRSAIRPDLPVKMRESVTLITECPRRPRSCCAPIRLMDHRLSRLQHTTCEGGERTERLHASSPKCKVCTHTQRRGIERSRCIDVRPRRAINVTSQPADSICSKHPVAMAAANLRVEIVFMISTPHARGTVRAN